MYSNNYARNGNVTICTLTMSYTTLVSGGGGEGGGEYSSGRCTGIYVTSLFLST